MKADLSKKKKRDTKRIFLKKGTCSRTFFFLLNREFGFPMDKEEQAADPLAGGIALQGYQCGMLWGSSLAVGAEAYRRTDNVQQGIALAVGATRHLMDSFVARTQSPDCGEITRVNWSNKFSVLKYLITGKAFSCFKLADKWLPEAISSAEAGLSIQQTDPPQQAMSCASEVVRLMGGSDAEMVMVGGFAGGMGLSGNACGALAAGVWMNTLARVRRDNYQYSLSDPILAKLLHTFSLESDNKMACSQICGRQFADLAEHTEFVKNGGCQKLIHLLAEQSKA